MTDNVDGPQPKGAQQQDDGRISASSRVGVQFRKIPIEHRARGMELDLEGKGRRLISSWVSN